MNLRKYCAVEAYMPFCSKEKEAGVWDFKGKVDNSRNSKHLGHKFLPGRPETMVHRGISNKQTCLGPPCLPHLVPMCWGEYAEVPFLKLALLSEFLRQIKGEGENLFLSLLGINCFQHKIICMPGWLAHSGEILFGPLQLIVLFFFNQVRYFFIPAIFLLQILVSLILILLDRFLLLFI